MKETIFILFLSISIVYSSLLQLDGIFVSNHEISIKGIKLFESIQQNPNKLNELKQQLESMRMNPCQEITVEIRQHLMNQTNNIHEMLDRLDRLENPSCVTGWTEVNVDGAKPTERWSHTTVLYGDAMYLFGGSKGAASYSDLWKYSFDQGLWMDVTPQNSPPIRRHHSAVVYEDAMYVYGGFHGMQRNDLWMYHFQYENWTLIESSPTPGDRLVHTTVVHSDNMWLFGGFVFDSTNFNDLWKFSFTLKEWEYFEPSSSFPSPRRDHSSVAMNDYMWVFGGQANSGVLQQEYFWRLHIPTLTWKSLHSEVTPRHSSDMYVYHDNIYVHGGISVSGDYHYDLWKFSTVNNLWMELKPMGPFKRPSERISISSIVYQDHLWIFGGNSIWAKRMISGSIEFAERGYS